MIKNEKPSACHMFVQKNQNLHFFFQMDYNLDDFIKFKPNPPQNQIEADNSPNQEPDNDDANDDANDEAGSESDDSGVADVPPAPVLVDAMEVPETPEREKEVSLNKNNFEIMYI
jgi:hypothetical protein